MTDKELIALVESKLPQELTVDEIELIRQRMRTSATVREALADQLQLDQYLSGVIGKVELSAERVFAAGANASRRRTSMLAWLGWSVCLLLVGFVVSMLVWPMLVPPAGHDREIAKANGQSGKAGIEGAVAGGVTDQAGDGSDPTKKPGPGELAVQGTPGGNSKPIVDPAIGPAMFDPNVKVAGHVGPGAVKITNNRIEFVAAAFVHVKNVAIDRDTWGAKIEGNSGVLHSTADGGWIEYEFPAPVGGMYRFELKYASAEPRPVRLRINGVVVKEQAAAAVTGSWLADGQREFNEGTFVLKAGLNKLKLETKGQMPHVSRLAFTLDQPAVAVAPKDQTLPWRTENQLGAPPRPMDEIAFDGFDVNSSPPSQEDARRWFTGNVSARDYNGLRLPVLDGVNRFNPLLAEDSVLRLSLIENQWLTLHFWRGKTGVSLRMQPDKGVLVAYQVNRQNPNQLVRALAGTDQDRNYRMNPSQMPARFDLRFHRGLLVVSRGEIELLRVPYEGMPDEILFDGHCLIRGLALVRTTSELPAEPAAKPIAHDYPRPADLNWNSEIPKGKEIELVKNQDGSIELKSQQSPTPGWIAFPLPDGGLGLHELIVEVDDVTPASHIGLGKGQGEPKYMIGFFKDNGSGSLSMRFSGWGDVATDVGVDYNGARTAAYAAKHQWLKFIGGAGLKCYSSLDGIHWTPWLTPLEAVEGPLTHLSMYIAQGGQPRSIKLRHVTLRKLESIESLAGPELLAKAPTVGPGDINVWNSEVTRLQPPGTAKSAWRRACAIKTVAAGGNADQVRQIIGQLLDEVMSAARPIDEQLVRLDEFALLDQRARDVGGANTYLQRYVDLGERAWREGNPRPWSTVFPAIVYSPLWTEIPTGPRLERLQRTELLTAIYAEKPRDVQRTLGAFHLGNVQDPLLNFAGDWLSRHGETDLGAERPHGRVVVRQHPMVEELNKEGFNLLGDFIAALESKAYRDACQLVTSTDGADSLGLWPDPRDPQLLVSVNEAIDLALKNDSELRKTMLRQFGPLGMLQVKQAIGEADSTGVAAVVARFRGTEAAAIASLWLGDRSLSTGDFAGARGYYRQAQKIGGLPDGSSIAARDRLAAAMMGQNSGKPVDGPVTMGEIKVGAKEFEALVAEMRRVHGNQEAVGAIPVAGPAKAPPPTGFELREIGRLDGELGENPGDWNPTNPPHDQRTTFLTPERDASRFVVPDIRGEPMPRPLDWAARQIATAADGDWLYVSNRFQVAAYNLKDGIRKWQTSLGGEHAHTHEWSLTPMRPLIVGKRLYVRRLVRGDNDPSPELAALDREAGQVIWRTRHGLKVVSDPLLTAQGLMALTLARADRQSNLYLSTFDPTNGVVVAQERLATLRETWWQERTCQLSALDDENLVAVFGGCVLCCDPSGKTRWVRRQEWIAPQEDPDWARQYQQPAIPWKDRLLVSQPGVAAVECIDAESGALVWRKEISGLRRINGLVDDRVIVESQTGLTALSADKGEPLWFHLAGDLLDAQICGGAGGIMYSRREKAPDSALRPVLVWLDVQSGRPKAYFPIEQLKHAFPLFGPFAASQNRLIAFAAGGENEPNRTIFELVAKGNANMIRAQEIKRIGSAVPPARTSQTPQ